MLFFDKVNYVGAFPNTNSQTDDWMRPWANMDPNQTYYIPFTGVEKVVASFFYCFCLS